MGAITHTGIAVVQVDRPFALISRGQVAVARLARYGTEQTSSHWSGTDGIQKEDTRVDKQMDDDKKDTEHS
jgi:hypothetical protein